jgi:hypothetical protein
MLSLPKETNPVAKITLGNKKIEMTLIMTNTQKGKKGHDRGGSVLP